MWICCLALKDLTSVTFSGMHYVWKEGTDYIQLCARTLVEMTTESLVFLYLTCVYTFTVFPVHRYQSVTKILFVVVVVECNWHTVLVSNVQYSYPKFLRVFNWKHAELGWERLWVWAEVWRSPMESLSYNECHYQSYLSAVLNCFYWKIPWTEELGTLQSMGLHRVRYNRTHAQYTRITLVILRASWEEESCQRKETNGKILCSSVVAV